jgi:GT2 family glycosyltransferase
LPPSNQLNTCSVTTVIPTWNQRILLNRVLRTLEHQKLRPSRVLVVDNGSSDGSVEMARELGADVLPLPANEGFAGAINRGIQASTTDWILLLNNDVELEPSWLQSVLAAA